MRHSILLSILQLRSIVSSAKNFLMSLKPIFDAESKVLGNIHSSRRTTLARILAQLRGPIVTKTNQAILELARNLHNFEPFRCGIVGFVSKSDYFFRSAIKDASLAFYQLFGTAEERHLRSAYSALKESTLAINALIESIEQTPVCSHHLVPFHLC